MFIDRPAEVERVLGECFLSNTMVVARNVRTRLTLPWYFGLKRFHGEQVNGDPSEVEPQHLGPNGTMTFHQIISACDASLISDCDSIEASIEYTDPLTGVVHTDECTVAIEDVVLDGANTLRKADVVVGYAKTLIVIGIMADNGNLKGAASVTENMASWAAEAAEELDDPEVDEIATLLATYVETLS